MLTRILVATAAAAALAVPAAAQQSQQQQGGQQQTQQQQGAGAGQDKAQMSEQAQACLRDLEQMDRRLAEAGYGRAGPRGYGVYGAPYGRTTPPATAGRTGALEPVAASTPRADMYVMMRAGYIMAVHGHDEGCQAVVQAVDAIGDRYEEAIRTGQIDEQEMQRWRGEYLGAAVKVSELQRPLRADEIIGTDVRNMRDEDLGDVEDVVLGSDGQIKYVIVSTGGFLGMGEELVPVRWNDLRMTTEPYRDTLVLDVSEDTFQQAPRVENRNFSNLTADADNTFERFWEDAKIGESQR